MALVNPYKKQYETHEKPDVIKLESEVQKELGVQEEPPKLRQLNEAQFQKFLADIRKGLYEKDLPHVRLDQIDFATQEQQREIENVIKEYFRREDGLGWNRAVNKALYVLHIKMDTSDGETWMTIPLSQTNYNAFIQPLGTGAFLYNVEAPPDWQYGSDVSSVPPWKVIKEFGIEQMAELGIKKHRVGRTRGAAKIDNRNEPKVEVHPPVVKDDDEPANYDRRGGSFFPYVFRCASSSDSKFYRKIMEELEKCQITDEIRTNDPLFKDACWIYALKQWCFETFKDKENRLKYMDRIANLTRRINDRNQDCKEIIEETERELDMKNQIRINYITKTEGETEGKLFLKTATRPIGALEKDAKITINCFEHHYFYEFKCDFCRADVMSFIKGQKFKRDSRYPLTSNAFIRILYDYDCFQPITFNDYLKLPNLDIPEITPETSLEYDPAACVSNYKPAEKEVKQKGEVFFGDTEADITGEIHRAYMFVVIPALVEKPEPIVGYGANCIQQVLDKLPNNSTIYFHNLGYDAHFFAMYGADGKSVIKGNKVYKMRMSYNGKTITLKDTLALINAPLRNFPKMFGLPAQEGKEVFPYKYYTMDRIKHYGNIAEACKFIDKQEDIPHFLENIEKIPNCKIDENRFDMEVYAKYYCIRDVELVKRGFERFRDDTMKAFNLDVFTIMTAPSLAHKYFLNMVYSNPEIKSYQGVVDAFIRKAILGGRCMTARNTTHLVEDEPYIDLDARSLYPSAMARMEIPLGAPIVLPPPDVEDYVIGEKELLSVGDPERGWSCYVIEVEFQPTTIHRDFPLFKIEGEDGNNEYSDTFTEPIIQYVSHIRFLDILEAYPDIQYRVIRGYFWGEGVDTKIQEVIKDVYKKRNELKELKNPLQEIYKLIMNSAYGKTIQKPIDTETMFMYDTAEKRKAHYLRNYNSIKATYLLSETPDKNNKLVERFEQRCAIDKKFYYSLIGVLVLDMSKRIMNEVMVLAEDIGCIIKYQDTDSIHIRQRDKPKLEKAFKEKYGRELVGTELGQFHSDFDSKILDTDTTYAKKCIFLGKKMYLDVLSDKNGGEDFHIRMKGVSQEAIAEAAPKYGGVWGLYIALYTGEVVRFNLLAGGKPSFDHHKSNFTISSRREFHRDIKVNSEHSFEGALFNWLYPNVKEVVRQENPHFQTFTEEIRKLKPDASEEEIDHLAQLGFRARYDMITKEARGFQDCIYQNLCAGLSDYPLILKQEYSYDAHHRVDIVITPTDNIVYIKNRQRIKDCKRAFLISVKTTVDMNRIKQDALPSQIFGAYAICVSHFTDRKKTGKEIMTEEEFRSIIPNPMAWYVVRENLVPSEGRHFLAYKDLITQILTFFNLL